MQSARKVLSVSDVNQYLKRVLQNDNFLSQVVIRGEISNFTHHRSGHLYFSLKDKNSMLKCVMFRTYAESLSFRPEHGMEVLAVGNISVFERDGVYQLYVENMLPAGAGALHIAYEQLKEKLGAEGLFAEERKRKLPAFPTRIGIITSPTGAAIQDMMSILRRRNKLIDIDFIPAIVQGQEGAASLCSALDKMYLQSVDVIIIGRGGGSLEDLWCFNEEAVVRKIAASPVPIISAVGHETDFTLADFAADMRAATPSMAAELAAPSLEKLAEGLALKTRLLEQNYRRQLEKKRLQLERYAHHPLLRQPQRLLEQQQQILDNQATALTKAMDSILQNKQHKFILAAEKLDSLSPLKVLSRGYSVCQDLNGKVIHSPEELAVDQRFKVTLQQGELYGRVVTGEEEENGTATIL
ncbi:MAG: exodeoxyribonuclease VII large subunit [Peptococcaceae bacterium]|nr:exodeoxyribonuclease VII large subunit [Peptococcaceae bacterium]